MTACRERILWLSVQFWTNLPARNLPYNPLSTMALKPLSLS